MFKKGDLVKYTGSRDIWLDSFKLPTQKFSLKFKEKLIILDVIYRDKFPNNPQVKLFKSNGIVVNFSENIVKENFSLLLK